MVIELAGSDGCDQGVDHPRQLVLGGDGDTGLALLAMWDQ